MTNELRIGIDISLTSSVGSGAPKTAGSLHAQIGFPMLMMPMSGQSSLTLLMGDLVSNIGIYDRAKFPPSQKSTFLLLLRADDFGL